MGDYTKSGEKIGTCGMAYYATKRMIQETFNSGDHSDDIKYYLNKKESIYFAFPFPEYDNKKIGEISNFHEGERTDFYFDFIGESHHKDITTHLHPKGGAGINLFHPCPYSENANTSTNFDKDKKTFRLTYQWNDRKTGNLFIVGECIYCGAQNIFESDEALQIVKTLKEKANYLKLQSENSYYHSSERERYLKESNYILKICVRMLETYTTPETPKKKEIKKIELTETKSGVKKGDIFSTSWGYDQTNVDFFQVVKINSKCFVTVKEVKQELTENSRTSALKDEFFKDEEYKVKVNVAKWNNSPYFKEPIFKHYNANLWNGEPKYYSNGH